MTAATSKTGSSAPSPSILSAAQLAVYFATNGRWIERQCAGLSHDDSLLQPAMRGNCLNWVIGHIAVHRDFILQALKQPKILGDEHQATYDIDSEPILEDDEDVVELETLLEAIEQSQVVISNVLAEMSAADFARQAFDDGPETVAQMVFFLYWHETYHLGQTEYLRQLAGTDDRIM